MGSSPHLRGSPGEPVDRHRHRGVIPAPAGQPGRLRREPDKYMGHPRTCGAAGVDSTTRRSRDGSSPHLRGSLVAAAELKIDARVIPAPAGQPTLIWPWRSSFSGHPRTCGAAGASAAGWTIPYGSSPHLRGSRPWWRRLNHRRGVIPAPAGQPVNGLATLPSDEGHPRTCGAAAVPGPSARGGAGSSPHLRGSHLDTWRDRRCPRVIPAPAGQPPR